MAWSEIETKIANPARKAHMTAKQIKYFGTARQKAALKAKRKAAAKKAHRARTKPKHNPSHKKKRMASSHRPRTAPKKKHKKTSAPKRKNLGEEIIVFATGNPAKKKGKAMAKSHHKKKKHSAASSHAGRPKKRMNRSYRKKRNFGGGALPRPMEWAKLGVGGIGGGVLTRLVPQMVAPASNTGAMGYLFNAITAVLVTLGVHLLAKDRFLTMGAATGGAIAIGLRIIGDQTPYGSQLALSGFGDYMVSNWTQPQRILNPNSAMWENGLPAGGQTPYSAAVPYGGHMSGADRMTSGNSY
jgi:hypothetical protein